MQATYQPIADNNVGQDTRHKIIEQLIEPSYYNDIQTTMRSKKCWKITGHIFETLSKVFISVSGIIGFASGFYPNAKLGLYAGTASTLSLASLQMASYCFKENKENAEELNIMLQKIKIDALPVFDETLDDKK